MWAVYNDSCGFFIGTDLSENEMKKQHSKSAGEPWENCVLKGDKCVEVLILPTQDL